MSALHEDTQGPIKKQKHENASGDAKQPPKAPGRFKVVSKVVMAMRRFQASLNPTYEYGKRPSDTDAEEQVGPNHVHVKPATPSGRVTSGRNASGRTSSGRPLSAGHQHGHKGNLLLRPLPPLQKVETS